MMAELPESSGEVLGYKETLFKILNKMGRYRESLSIQQQMLRAMDVNAQTPIDKLYLEMARNYHGLKDYPHAADYYEKHTGRLIACIRRRWMRNFPNCP